MKTDNELIAEFMRLESCGVKYDGQEYFRSTHDENKIVPAGGFSYDISWDWLMPVVEKIYQTKILNSDQPLLERLSRLDKTYNDFSVIDRIGPIHKAVVEFIKYYNKTKP